MRDILILLVLAAIAVGCNTVQGMGKDIKQGGEALERMGSKR
ncbi:MAG: entericidin A/B family lipoprotein [Betaproteobacteria bacterium]|nr:entericidin A/B family lipoprotein [Betaproteobacteria bacterium]